MLVKVLKSIFKLGVYAAGVAAVVGVWDYTRQAKAADFQYTVGAHAASLADRYGTEAQFAVGALDIAKGGVRNGLEWADNAGLLGKTGDASPTPEVEMAQSDLPEIESGVLAPVAEPSDAVEIAAVRTVLAPETSLFPRVRALR
ncbi:hypothetical protein [Marivita sp.]|uniref:hypothetical protein n=1 Tax=Marivita sp. TaxID=2003365 RepID=UPI0025BA06F2|nr:hypothetical protein [Marivita sp.]